MYTVEMLKRLTDIKNPLRSEHYDCSQGCYDSRIASCPRCLQRAKLIDSIDKILTELKGE